MTPLRNIEVTGDMIQARLPFASAIARGALFGVGAHFHHDGTWAQALATSTHLDCICYLDVQHNDLSRTGKAALRKRFGKAYES